jgi:hypothetical protein
MGSGPRPGRPLALGSGASWPRPGRAGPACARGSGTPPPGPAGSPAVPRWLRAPRVGRPETAGAGPARGRIRAAETGTGAGWRPAPEELRSANGGFGVRECGGRGGGIPVWGAPEPGDNSCSRRARARRARPPTQMPGRRGSGRRQRRRHGDILVTATATAREAASLGAPIRRRYHGRLPCLGRWRSGVRRAMPGVAVCAVRRARRGVTQSGAGGVAPGRAEWPRFAPRLLLRAELPRV